MNENPSETSRTASGIAGAGQDVHEPRTERYARNPGHLVVRKTGLRGQIAASAPPQQKVRCTTGGELVEQDVPDLGPQKAGRDKICPLSGWKDFGFQDPALDGSWSYSSESKILRPKWETLKKRRDLHECSPI